MYRGRGNEDVEREIDAQTIIKPRNNVPSCSGEGFVRQEKAAIYLEQN